jgi:predicted urease superfamily metal-dependent hydrolase
MAQKTKKLSEKIAKQIAQIAKDSVKIDIEIVQFLKEDFEEIRRMAKERGLSFPELLAEILEGIKKGLVEGGVESLEMVKNILALSKNELEDLEEKWKEKRT